MLNLFIFDQMALGLLLLCIQKHSLDSGNRVSELFKLIFETLEQSNLFESKRSQALNYTRSNVGEDCFSHLLSVNRVMLKPTVEVVMRVVGSVEL
jgi:hypothetical protein